MKLADQNNNNTQSQEPIPVNFLIFSKGQTAARKGLGEILSSGVNFLAITGPSGSGKTTLLDQFSHHLTRNVTLAQITGYQNSSEDILHDVLSAFGQTLGDLTHSELLKALFNFLLEQQSQNKKPVLIIDNAETLDHNALMSFHSLSELRSEGNILLRVVLAGDNDLVQQLNQSEFGPSAFLNPLIHIEPFTEEETYLYLNKHYRLGKTSKKISFSKRAAKLIHFYCHGNPLATNKLSSLALRLANWKKKRRVTHHFASSAVKTPVWVLFSEQFAPIHTKNEAPATATTATDSNQVPRVIIFKCNHKIAEHSLGRKLVLLGRAPDSTVVLRRPSVSRRHACLTILNNQVWIKNLSSTNKTYVNAQSIENYPLRDGDVIRIGDFLVLFIYENTMAHKKTPRSMELTPETLEEKNPMSMESMEAIMDPENIDAETLEVASLNSEENTSTKPHLKRKKRPLSVVKRRERQRKERAKRLFLVATVGLIALLGPMLAVLFFLEHKTTEPVVEIPAKMDKTSSAQASNLPPVIDDAELLTMEINAEPFDKSSTLNEAQTQDFSPSTTSDQLQNLISEARQYLQHDKLSQSLNLIIEGIKLDPENKDLLQLQVESIHRLAAKEREWNNLSLKTQR